MINKGETMKTKKNKVGRPKKVKPSKKDQEIKALKFDLTDWKESHQNLTKDNLRLRVTNSELEAKLVQTNHQFETFKEKHLVKVGQLYSIIEHLSGDNVSNVDDVRMKIEEIKFHKRSNLSMVDGTNVWKRTTGEAKNESVRTQ